MERDEEGRPADGPGDGRTGWDDDRPPTDYWDGRVTNEDFVDPPHPDTPQPTPRDPARPLYDGRPVRDPYDRGGGHRRVSEAVWERAREEYLEGDSCPTVCARHGMAPSTFRQRARDEGWRRIDQPDPEPVDLEAEEAAGLLDYAEMARHALVRLNRAVLRGRVTEAAGWMRLHARLLDLARTTAQPEPEPESAAPKPASRPPRTPDAQDTVMRRMRVVGDLSRALTGLDTRDPASRRVIDLGLEALEAMRPPPVSDDSYGSDGSDGLSAPAGSEPAPP